MKKHNDIRLGIGLLLALGGAVGFASWIAGVEDWKGATIELIIWLVLLGLSLILVGIPFAILFWLLSIKKILEAFN